MPRRKRNRRNKRRQHKPQQNAANIQNTIAKSDFAEDTPTKDHYMTLPIITPLKTPSTTPSNSTVKTRSGSVVCTTPKSASDYELPPTNLREVFDSDTPGETLNNITPKCSRSFRGRSPLHQPYINNLRNSISGVVLLNRHRMGYLEKKTRSNSSMSKLHSPGLDKIPIMVDVATQTVYFDNDLEKRNSTADSDIYLQNCINIFETPKIKQINKLEQALDFESPVLSLFQNNLNDLPSSRGQKNSYVSPQVMLREFQNESIGEESFFNPLLNPASTPIEKLQRNEVLESMARNILNSNLERKKGNERLGSYIYNSSTPKTPNNKVFKADKFYTQKINKIENCVNKWRNYKSISPKKLKDIMKVQSNKQDVPKTFSPQKVSFTKSDSFLNVSNANIYARFMTNVKKLHSRYSTKWLNRIFEVCNWLGITVRRSLSSLCVSTQKDDIFVEKLEPTFKKCNCGKCKDYQKQIITLSTKLDDLGKERKEDKEKICTLIEEIGEMKKHLTELDDVKKKICEIEEKLERRPLVACTVPIPPPPPPCPPPPPPFPTYVQTPKIKITKSKKFEENSCENSRPVISLHEILNVKLKKTSVSFNRTDRSSTVGRQSLSFQSRC